MPDVMLGRDCTRLLDARTDRDRTQLEVCVRVDDLKGLAANRARGTEKGNPRHESQCKDGAFLCPGQQPDAFLGEDSPKTSHAVSHARAFSRYARERVVGEGVPQQKDGRRALKLYLDQNYLSGFVKHKPAFRELEPVLRAAVQRGTVSVLESEAHRIESAARPDLRLLELLRELSAGASLPEHRGTRERYCERRLLAVLDTEFPERRTRESDVVDLQAISLAIPHCDLVTCDAFMVDLVRRTGIAIRFHAELFSGRRQDADRLRDRLEEL